MLMNEFSNLDGEECPKGLREGPSGTFKGPCSGDKPCREKCQEEGFETGFCPAGMWLDRSCTCCKP